MILHRECQVGPAHRPLLLFQSREGVVGMQLMQHMTVDVKQIAAVGARTDAVKVPDSVE
jgi:hypothetical protein